MQKTMLALLLIAPLSAFAQSRETREQHEIKQIFSIIVPKMEVRRGDGLGSDIECVFSRKWDSGLRAGTEGQLPDQHISHVQLTIEQAIDPMKKYAGMFCDYAERDAKAQQTAFATHKSISVASVGFSYPAFGPDLQTAVVLNQRWSRLFLPDKRRILPVGSEGTIKLWKRGGNWSFKLLSTGSWTERRLSVSHDSDGAELQAA